MEWNRNVYVYDIDMGFVKVNANVRVCMSVSSLIPEL